MTAGMYPVFLEQELRERLPGRDVVVIDKGRQNTRSGDVLEGLEASLRMYDPLIVVVMAGFNDGHATLPYGGLERTLDGGSELALFRLVRVVHNHWLAGGFVAEGPARSGSETTPRLSDDRLRELAGSYNDYKRLARLRADVMTSDNATAEQRSELAARLIALTERATETDPGDVDAWVAMGITFMEEGRHQEAAAALRHAVELAPEYAFGWYRLAEASVEMGDRAVAIAYLQRTLELQPGDHKAQSLLGKLTGTSDSERNQSQLPGGPTAEPRAASEASPASSLHLTARTNLLRVAHVLRERGVSMVAVQYPSLDPTPLEDLLSGAGAVVVENRESFAQAVQERGFETLYLDDFGGTFGHCTDEGNRIIGTNIADAIDTTWFHPVP